jgi:hypothetical protein
MGDKCQALDTSKEEVSHHLVSRRECKVDLDHLEAGVEAEVSHHNRPADQEAEDGRPPEEDFPHPEARVDRDHLGDLEDQARLEDPEDLEDLEDQGHQGVPADPDRSVHQGYLPERTTKNSGWRGFLLDKSQMSWGHR